MCVFHRTELGRYFAYAGCADYAQSLPGSTFTATRFRGRVSRPSLLVGMLLSLRMKEGDEESPPS